jgi:hypothetical protein
LIVGATLNPTALTDGRRGRSVEISSGTMGTILSPSDDIS